MKPPGQFEWQESAAQIGGSSRQAFLAKFDDTLMARKFVDENWHWAYSQRAALFINCPPKILGEPTGYTSDGQPCYRPLSPPAEIWFLPGVQFEESWGFAKVKGFVNTVPASVVEACESFLSDLATRHPIGVEAVGQGWASFRRFSDGGAFEFEDMRRAWELNIAVLGGRQDTMHLDRRVPRQFVRNGMFHFGL